MPDFRDHAGLILALGGAAIVAAAETVDAQSVTVRAWVARNRVPPEYWPTLIELALAKGLCVTADWLMRTTPARRRSGETDEPDKGLTGLAGLHVMHDTATEARHHD